MIKHIVAWNFKEELSESEKAESAERMKKELEGLAGVVPGLVYIKVHISPEDTSNRDIVLDSLLTSKGALALYKDHPSHLKAGEFVRTVTKDRVALDFEM